MRTCVVVDDAGKECGAEVIRPPAHILLNDHGHQVNMCDLHISEALRKGASVNYMPMSETEEPL